MTQESGSWQAFTKRNEHHVYAKTCMQNSAMGLGAHLVLTGVLPPPSPSHPEGPGSSDTNLLLVVFEPRREVLLMNASFVEGDACFY